ncbi:MAG: hypothetical protein ACFCUQ_10135 [Kiloniellales bacterium]
MEVIDWAGLRQSLAGVADAATVAVCIALWRIDRRLVRVETKLEGSNEQ